MFIKILTPNHNGKIELTVADLEALIQEAVDKAVREKCSNCSRGYYGGITYLNGTQLNHTEPSPDWSKVICGTANDSITLNGGLTVCEASNEVDITTQASTLTSKINALINQGEK